MTLIILTPNKKEPITVKSLREAEERCEEIGATSYKLLCGLYTEYAVKISGEWVVVS